MPDSRSHLSTSQIFDPSASGASNLTTAWARAWRAAPDVPQFHDPVRGWITRGEVDTESATRAGRLAALGLTSGDRVLLSAKSCFDLVASYIACLRLGLVVIPTNTAYGRQELAYVIGDARPQAAIIDNLDRGHAIAAINPSIHRLTPSLEIPDGALPDLDSISAVLLPTFRASEILDCIDTYQATLFFGVPTMYHRLASDPKIRALAALRLCVSGSAPLPASLHEEIQRSSKQRVLERYGMSETLMLVSNPYDRERRAGTVGWPLPGVELRLEGDPAEIQVRGPNVFRGYWERPEANAAAFTEDGWFRTGDLGAIDADGYVSIVGRAKELIISGGFNVYPREVEDALRGHPLIDDVAVVGEASEEWGERVVAYAVVKEPSTGEQTGDSRTGIELDDLRHFVSDSLAPFKHPRGLYVIPELPRNALGKVQKHRLRKGVVQPE